MQMPVFSRNNIPGPGFSCCSQLSRLIGKTNNGGGGRVPTEKILAVTFFDYLFFNLTVSQDPFYAALSRSPREYYGKNMNEGKIKSIWHKYGSGTSLVYLHS